MFIILLKNHKEDFDILSDYAVMRAVLRDTDGGKVAEEFGIKVHHVDEAYTSKTSCISANVVKNQEKKKKNQPILTNDLNANRVKRGLLKDTVINKVFNADLNGAVNHIKVATKQSFNWLKKYLFKLSNPIKIKSDYEFNNFLLHSVSDKSILNNLRKERCFL